MANKYTRIQRYRRMIGAPCTYCSRPTSMTEPGLHPIGEHIEPRSLNGKRIVVACDACDRLKKNMTFAQWTEFMQANPRWWELPHSTTKCIERR